jgi:hypothetical protein
MTYKQRIIHLIGKIMVAYFNWSLEVQRILRAVLVNSILEDGNNRARFNSSEP